jgi:hypothetical protein
MASQIAAAEKINPSMTISEPLSAAGWLVP